MKKTLIVLLSLIAMTITGHAQTITVIQQSNHTFTNTTWVTTYPLGTNEFELEYGMDPLGVGDIYRIEILCMPLEYINGHSPLTPNGTEKHSMTGFVSSVTPYAQFYAYPASACVWYTNETTTTLTWKWEVESFERDFVFNADTNFPSVDFPSVDIYVHEILTNVTVNETNAIYVGQEFIIFSDRYFTNNNTIFECTGYVTDTNNTYVTGSTASQVICEFTVTNHSTISRTWTPIQYYLDVSSSSNGVIVSPFNTYAVDEWKDKNAGGQIYAQPDALYEFDYWSGDIDAGQTNANPAPVFMNQPRNIVANFKRSTPAIPIIKNIADGADGADGFSFEWSSELNREYTVLYSTNLPTWNTLTNLTGTGNTMSQIDDRDLPKVFYRLDVY